MDEGFQLPGLGARKKTLDGAEGRTRTGTAFTPPPPQDGVSTNSTTSAKNTGQLTQWHYAIQPQACQSYSKR